MSSKEQKDLPSARWQSFDGWDYNGMKERLEDALEIINKVALISHAEHVVGRKFGMSEPFSAGQYWICFELVAEDGSLVIARVRLPRHPEVSLTATDNDLEYAIECEIATMRYVRSKLPNVTIPRIYAYEPAGSPPQLGNMLLDMEYDMTRLPPSVQQQIMTQWTRVQAELATITLPQIGSISSLSPTGEPIIGRIASAAAEGFWNSGPFNTSAEYFAAAGQAAVDRFNSTGGSGSADGHWAAIGALVFCDIVAKADLFQDVGAQGSFPLNHIGSSTQHWPIRGQRRVGCLRRFNNMDLGTQNILVDDAFRFLATIDWEFAQTAPWQVNHYPMPFPPLCSQRHTDAILADPGHLAHANVTRQEAARRMYQAAFRFAEEELREQGRPTAASFAEVLDCTASRIYVCFTQLGRMPEADEELVQRMARLAFGWDDAKIKSYITSVNLQ
ncbi:hypothetical protein A9K55_008939 [Cordyceps militaris]|uniref:Aminoglycoside phosphotransferase domain-containing protein n=1 Tax=Cordyceps militaris TaxID=73501 RepID=A0A2H4SKG0_CORMI|nr:hypothetical protein A9K55_008939 [Cordyceps militaris]